MKVPFLSKEELSKLNTKRLLAYKRKFMQFPDFTLDQFGYDPDGKKMSKSHPWWQETYQHLKEVLSTREHVER